jgi:predicted esterase
MILVPATVHGRVLIEPDEGAAVSSRVLVGFHGYAQAAGDMMQDLNRIPGASDWTRVSIQGLNRFYTRGDTHVVANWMTREDRDQAIADNIAYVDSAIEHLSNRAREHGTGAHEHPSTRALVFVGFSQGVAMAYRAALSGARPVAGIIALAGDIPPEFKTDAATRHPWPKVLIGVGHLEQWYSSDKVDADRAFLESRGIDHSIVRFKGGHEWGEEFRNAAGAFLAAM